MIWLALKERPASRAGSTGSAMLSAMALLALVGFARPARAQLDSREAILLENQILELRHQIQQPGQAGGAVVAPPVGQGMAPASGAAPGAGDLTPQLLDRVSTLEGQVRALRGQLDQLSNQVQQQNAALTKQIGDMTFAMQQGHAAPAAAPPAAPRTAAQALAAGEEALARRDYPTAQSAANEVLTHQAAPERLNARFLLARSLAGQREYQQAATTYYDVYSTAPRGAHAPEALLGVGSSLLALGDKSDACQALHKLHVEFPQPAVAVRRAALSLRGRAACH